MFKIQRKIIPCFFILIVYCLVTSSFSNHDNSYSFKLNEIRIGFYDAVQDSKKAEILIKKINSIEPKSALITVYNGATCAIMAKEKWSPFSAIKLLKKSNVEMNKAVKASPENLEIRFIRFAVQKNIPSYLGFSNNIEEDKKYIIKHIDSFYNPTLNKEMRDYIFWFMTEQGGYNEKQIKLIKEKLQG
ncbi:MAG: hypothetical protein GW818_00010 [Flavobacteriales bacterium]|nr:hypothetical protein [Flavobacteriales bacterium]PJC61548.1 MAG: hypothetical protein CO022_09295 [Flavobacteriales bacterium CG_4_9_14_0_2_um_filter_32_27]